MVATAGMVPKPEAIKGQRKMTYRGRCLRGNPYHGFLKEKKSDFKDISQVFSVPLMVPQKPWNFWKSLEP